MSVLAVVLLILLLVAGIFVLLLVGALAFVLLRFWPQIRLLWQVMQLLPDFGPLLHATATGMRVASDMSARTGQVACAAGKSIRAAGGVVEGISLPTVQLHSKSLWQALVDAKLLPTIPQGLPDIRVLEPPFVTIGSQSVFPPNNRPITKTGENLEQAASFLGYTCQTSTNPLNPPADPPPPDTVARAFHDAAAGIDGIAELLESAAAGS